MVDVVKLFTFTSIKQTQTQNDMKTSTVKNGIGHYTHIKTNKYIVAYYGSINTVWNIYNDFYATDEYSIGFNSKKDAIDFLNNEYLKTKIDLCKSK